MTSAERPDERPRTGEPASDEDLRRGPRERRGTGVAALLIGLAVSLAGLADVVQSGSLARPQGADAPAYLRIAATLLATGGLELPRPATDEEAYRMGAGDVYASQWALTADGRLFPKHSVLFGVALAPGVALAGVPGARVTALLLGGLLASVATSVAARHLGPVAAVLSAAAVFLASPGARNVLWGINVDTAIALIWLASLASADRDRLVAAGALAGLLFFLRPTAPVLLAGLLPLLASRSQPALLRFAAGFLPPLLVLAALNTLWWGAPWRTAYDRAAVLIDGRWEAGSHAATFHGDLVGGLRILFAHPDGGLLATAPVALLGLAGLAIAFPGRRFAFAATLPALAAYLVLAPYDHIRIVPEVAYRFALPLVAASVLPLAAVARAGQGLAARLLARAARS